MVMPLLDYRSGAMRGVICLVVCSLAVLVGLFSWTASDVRKHNLGHQQKINQPRKSGAQGTLPSLLFRPESNMVLRDGQGLQPNMLERDGVVGTVTRSVFPSLESQTGTYVPRTIWRTGKSREGTPEFATDLYNSWTKLNPGWDQYFLDDEDIEAFVAAHYNDTVLQAFQDLPLGVMKADLFRYASPRRLPKQSCRLYAHV